MNECLICLECADIPHKLPCCHIFCYYCILKHIKTKDFCPKCFSSPYTISDLSTEEKKTNRIIIPFLIFKRTESNLIKILKKYQINTTGSKHILEWRFNELVDLLMVEQYRDKPMSNVSIAWKIHSKEASMFGKKRKNLSKIYKSLVELKSKLKPNELN